MVLVFRARIRVSWGSGLGVREMVSKEFGFGSAGSKIKTGSKNQTGSSPENDP